jgi:SAM-dependent methyltransferase
MEGLQSHWEEIHLAKYQDVSWWQDKSQLWLDVFDGLSLARHSNIIDVGSGASDLLDVLREVGFKDVSALDISAVALDRLKARLERKIPDTNFYVADVCDFESGRTFDVWHDRAVFHFLTEAADQARYCDSVVHNLAAKGYLIIATFAPDGPEQCSGLPVARHDIKSLQEVFGEKFDLIDWKRRIHNTPWGSEQAFTIARFKCTVVNEII